VLDDGKLAEDLSLWGKVTGKDYGGGRGGGTYGKVESGVLRQANERGQLGVGN
jgi:hypothetical protein